MSVYTLQDFLTPDECDAVVACFPRATPAAINRPSGGATVERGVRRSRVAFLVGDAGTTITRRVRDLLWLVNGRFYQFELAGMESLQLAEYGEGDAYGWHADLGPGSAARRKLSLSVQLSSAADYDGGELQFWGEVKGARERGSAIVFPSYEPHQVSPVTRGFRRSLVAWATGERGFR